MPNRPPRYNPRVGQPQAQAQRQPEQRPKVAERGYGSRWRSARAAYLASNPLCVRCHAEGRVTEANEVDHIIPHKGNTELFWDSSGNWQSLCADCHRKKTAREDGAFGRPVINHPPANRD